jgi:RimJ/RimL family protein N-acetyltransferase
LGPFAIPHTFEWRDNFPLHKEYPMEVTIREAVPSDATQIIAYVNRLSEEPHSNIEISPGEFNRTVEEEAGFLAEFAASANSVFLVAESDGTIVGILNCKGSNRKAIRHAVTLGMSVDQDRRRQGIGSQLMARAIAWAKSTGTVKRIELAAFARNEIAIHLYEKFGFEIEGRRRKAGFRDGEYLDGVIMALLL